MIHFVKFRDIDHIHDSEELDSQQDLREFTGKIDDMIRKGAILRDS